MDHSTDIWIAFTAPLVPLSCPLTVWFSSTFDEVGVPVATDWHADTRP